ncbi:15148_t:CDS:2, partial [Entrophospora sp. SA101]
KIIDQIKKYDEIINDLNLDINLENFETVENLNVLVEEGFNDVTQTLELMKKNMDNIGNNVDNLGSNMEFVMEMVAWISKNMEELSKKSDQPNFKSEFPDKVLDSCKLTDPPPGEDTLRGKVFKKLLNKVQPVACKPFEALTNEKEKELSKGYLTILSNLQHSKSVISFYGVSYVDGKDALVFDWAEFGNLKGVYEKYDINWKEKLKIAHDICLGLQFIHECQIFHHDVRCENILIMGPELTTPKITNFRLSRKQMDISKKIPSLNKIMPWMAPEKLNSNPMANIRYTIKCEIYSFGMLLWELAFQQVPYLKRFNNNYEEISQHIRKGHREYLNFESDEIQKCFKNIISTVIQKNYFTKIKPHCEDITDSKIKKSTLDDAIKLHKERTDESRKKAWKYFEYHADTLNDFTAKYWKGYYLSTGLGGAKKDPKKAKELFKEAADNDVAIGQFHYATLIAAEADNDPSLIEGCISYLEKAANNGNLPALFNLGNFYYNGKWNIPQDREK